MIYLHLTIDERSCIATMMRRQESLHTIALVLKRSPSTISREIRRNYSPTGLLGEGYYPHTAQVLYRNRKKKCHQAATVKSEIKTYIEDRLHQTWSPEQIACSQSPFQMPSFKTIYRWIEQRLICRDNNQVLRRKGRKAFTRETRGKINAGTPIKKRDKSVYRRIDYGHWEADTMVSGRGKSKSCLAVLAERKSRLYLALPISNRTEESVRQAIVELLTPYKKQMVKTITCDRGKEFSGFSKIESELGCKVYFADPYCAWQKGTVENSNGLLREFLPKGCSLHVSRQRLQTMIDLINRRPRKCNDFISSYDVVNRYLKNCT